MTGTFTPSAGVALSNVGLLPVGMYQICWGYVPGHFIPACQSATITAGNTTTITGTYG